MRKITFLLCLCFFYLSQAQSQDLAKLALGEVVRFNAIYDKDGNNVEGYFVLYNNGKANNEKDTFEYFFLDKNLNIIANKEFEAENYINYYRAFTNIRGKITLSPSLTYDAIKKGGGTKNFKYPSNKEVDLSTNEMVDREYKCFEDQKLIDCPPSETLKTMRDERKAEKKEKGFVYISKVYETKYDNYVVTEYDDYNKYTSNNKISLLKKDGSKIWSFDYNKDATKKKGESLRILDYDENLILSILISQDKNEYKYDLLIFDIKTGKVLKKESLNTLVYEQLPEVDARLTIGNITKLYSQTGYLDNDKSFDDKYVLVGKLYKYGADALELGRGYIRMIIDKKDLSVSFAKIDYLNDFKNFIPKIGNYGKLPGNYYLSTRAVYFKKNGGVGILTEMYKYAGQYTADKNKDFYYIDTDENFKIINVQPIEKVVSKWSVTDYLFAQNIKGGDDVVFFYKDLVKEEGKKKVLKLYINTIINDKFNQEVIPIGGKDSKSLIIPYVAKEGYILLNEKNDNEKYDQIRLEKLNY